MIPPLPPPDRPFPIENARYEIKPGLRRFSGNVFQLDQQFERYRRSKQTARAQRLSKYVATANLTPEVEQAVHLFILHRLASEHPTIFLFDGETLRSGLTGQTLHFSAAGDYLRAEPDAAPPFVCGLDALSMQVQEDLAIMSTKDDQHWLSGLHLCSPNHWSAEEKIGKTFARIHEPVAGIRAINLRAVEWVRTMVNAVEGLTRFAWGVATDDELNHHPDRIPGRNFDRSHPIAFLRVERQTMWGFPRVGASLFTIRTTLIDCAEIRRCADEREALISAIRSMTPASLRYKGIDAYKTDLLDWLESARI